MNDTHTLTLGTSWHRYATDYDSAPPSAQTLALNTIMIEKESPSF